MIKFSGWGLYYQQCCHQNNSAPRFEWLDTQEDIKVYIYNKNSSIIDRNFNTYQIKQFFFNNKSHVFFLDTIPCIHDRRSPRDSKYKFLSSTTVK